MRQIAPPTGGSGWRLLAGALLFIVAMVIAVYGFLSLVRVLDGGGIATIIWDLSKRYERPTNR